MQQKQQTHLIEIKTLGGRLSETHKPLESRQKTEKDETGYICTLSTAPLNKTGNKIEHVAADYTGEGLIFSDSLGNVFVAHLYKNRFITVGTNSRCYALEFLDNNKLMFAVATYDRNVKIFNNAGTLVETLKEHKSKVFKIETNYRHHLIFTLSADALNLWNLKTFRRVRTLFPREQPFQDAHFSPDGDHLITRFEVSVRPLTSGEQDLLLERAHV